MPYNKINDSDDNKDVNIGYENKIAVLLLSLNVSNAAKVLSLMEPYEARMISQIILSYQELPNELIAESLRDIIKELSASATLTNNINRTKNILEEILGKGKLDDIMGSIKYTTGTIWSRLSKMNSNILSSYLKNEHPQIIAIIISQLTPSSSAKLLSLFPEELVIDVIMRIANLDSVKHDILSSIEYALQDNLIASESLAMSKDYRKLVADIFNNLDRNTEVKFMTTLEKNDKEMADYVQKYMFTFDDLLKIDNVGIQKLVNVVERDKLTLALKGAIPEVKELFFKNMSERASNILKDDIETLGPIRVQQVDEAQSYIIDIARKLIDKGEILIEEGDNKLIY